MIAVAGADEYVGRTAEVTTGFTQAVEVQFRALGFEPAVLYVLHPFQNRTREELQKIAHVVVEPALTQARRLT